MPPGSSRIRPVDRVAQAVAKCTVESMAYAKCVVHENGGFENIYKDKCKKEFEALQACIKKHKK